MSRVALVISDVDGTLVTPDKKLTADAIRAAKRLDEHGIGFTLTSSRPPFGMRMLVEPLGLKLPLGAFNGSLIVDPKLNVIECHFIPETAVMKAIAVLKDCQVDLWLFTNDRWMIVRDDGHYVMRERKTIDVDPVVVTDLSKFVTRACKIVGVSDDPDKLERCEREMQHALDGSASVARSQSYYLDITPPRLDKGTFVEAMALRLGIGSEAIVTIGDMRNDLAMFEKSGTSIAMGNATPEVKARATRVTASNEHEGFAKAIDTILAAAKT